MNNFHSFSFCFTALTTNDSMIYSNEDNNANDINTNEQDQSSSSSHPLFSKQQKVHFNKIFDIINLVFFL